jgi:hypothetical protein
MAWVPFRMDMTTALYYWRGMLNITNFNLDSKRLLLILAYLGFLTTLEWILYRYRERIIVSGLPQWMPASLIAAALFLLLIASSRGTETPFIYQGF